MSRPYRGDLVEAADSIGKPRADVISPARSVANGLRWAVQTTRAFGLYPRDLYRLRGILRVAGGVYVRHQRVEFDDDLTRHPYGELHVMLSTPCHAPRLLIGGEQQVHPISLALTCEVTPGASPELGS